MHTSLEQALERFCDLENIRIMDTPNKSESSEYASTTNTSPNFHGNMTTLSHHQIIELH